MNIIFGKEPLAHSDYVKAFFLFFFPFIYANPKHSAPKTETLEY